MRLRPLLQHVEHAVGGKVGDDAAVTASQVQLVDSHDYRRLVANSLLKLLDQILGDVLDGIDGETRLLGKAAEGSSEAAFADRVDQPAGSSTSFVQEGEIQRQRLATGIATITRSVDLQPHRLHLLRRIGKRDLPVAVPVQWLAAFWARRQRSLEDFGDDGDDPLRTLKVHRSDTRQVQEIKHSGHPNRSSACRGSARR